MKNFYFSLFAFFCPLLLLGQYSADFSIPNKGVQSIAVICASTDPTTCDGYDVSGVNWTMSGTVGDPFNFLVGEYVNTRVSGNMETRDPDGDVCVDSPILDISGLGTVTMTVTVTEVGSHEGTDHVTFTYTTDGSPVSMSVNDDFNTVTWTPTTSGNQLTLTVCLDNNSLTENFILSTMATNLGGPLPIELSGFFLSVMDDNKVRISWQTAAEVNNDYMVVERSTDGKRFVSIGEVDGTGNTTKAQNYSFIDENPVVGKNYYRLRQVDFDGTEKIHKVRAVELKSDIRKINIVPNPVVDNTATVEIVTTSEEPAEISLIDRMGRTVRYFTHQLIEGKNMVDVETTSLPGGTYYLKVVTGGQALHEPLMIAR